MATDDYQLESGNHDVTAESNGDSSMQDNHPVWTYYTITVTDRIEGRNMKKIKCKSCAKVWMNMRRDRAKNHIEKCLGVVLPKFKTWPSGVDTSTPKKTGKKVPGKRGRPRRQRQDDNSFGTVQSSVNQTQNSSCNNESGVTTALGRASAGQATGSTSARKAHLNISGSHNKKRRRLTNAETANDARKTHDVIAEWVITQSIPFSVIDDPLFMQVFHNLSASYAPPSSDVVLNTILPSLNESLIKQMNKCVAESDDRSITLEFDIWTDRSHKTYYAFVLHIAGTTAKRFLHSLVQDAVPTVEAIASALNAVIADVGENKINCLKGESTREVRELVTSGMPQIIQHNCVYRLITLLVADLIKIPDVQMALTACVKIYDFFSSNAEFRTRLSDFPAISQLEDANGTRLLGQETLLRFVTSNEKTIKHLIDTIRPDTLAPEHRDILTLRNNSGGVWDKISMISKFLGPLAQLVKLTEDENARLSDFVHYIIAYIGQLQYGPSCSSRNFLLDTTIKRFKELDKGLMFAAYSVDPRYRMAHITSKAKSLATAYLVKLCFDSGIRTMTPLNNFKSQFFMYEQRRNPFKAAIGPNDDPVVWWSGIEGVSPLLRDTSIRLLRLKLASAMCERLWNYLDMCNYHRRSRVMRAQFEGIARVFMKNRPSSGQQNNGGSSITNTAKTNSELPASINTANFLQEIHTDIVDEVYPFVDAQYEAGIEFDSINWFKEFFTLDPSTVGIAQDKELHKEEIEQECRLEDALSAICPDAVAEI